jgi:enoyl-CoA hydratase
LAQQCSGFGALLRRERKGRAAMTVRYEVDGAVATITLDRPEAANAQNAQLIVDLDAAFDRAGADDAVVVVVLAAEGKHFSAGHDLKELMAGEEHWAAMRATPEGKLRHEQEMYFDKLVKIRDFRKITIAAVQGACSAAGLMLACMCDLIVAADDAKFSNPVLRMSGVGVELLVEPWELGPRKAKEFLLLSETFTAEEAERYGLVNKVVPRAELTAAARAMADAVALVPPLTAEAVKASINHMVDRMGQRDSWRYHFALHQFVSNTPTALDRAEARKAGGMDAVRAEQAGEHARRADRASASEPGGDGAREPSSRGGGAPRRQGERE